MNRTSSGAPPAGQLAQLCVVDLASSTGAMPVVRALAERAVRNALRRAGGASRCRLLVHGGEGDPPIADGVLPTIRPADILGPTELTGVHDWVEAVSREVIDGSGEMLFPVVGGVKLADLARLELQSYLFNFALVARSVAALLDSAPAAEVVILAAERERAEAIAAMSRRPGTRVRVRWVPFVTSLRAAATRVARIRSAPSATAPLPAELYAAGANGVGVLTVSETNPMAETFAVIERHLDPARCGRIVRAQFGKAVAVDGSTTVIPLGRPGVVAPRVTGRYAGRWSDARRRIATLHVRRSLAGHELEAPLMTIMQRFFMERFDVMTEQVEYAHAMLDAARPSLLVVGNDRWYVSQAFVQAARVRGIPSVCVQDGVATDSAFWRWISADTFIASSDEVAAMFRRSGTSGERVEVSGQPRYDELFALRARDGVEHRSLLGIPEGAPLVLFASQPHQNSAYTEEVLRAILRVPGVRLLLRPHPAEPAGRYEAYVTESADRVFMARGHGLSTMLLAADIVVIESSTVGLEAALLGRPVVTANFAGTPTLVPYAERRLARRARNGAELTAAISEIVAAAGGDSVAFDALERFVGPFDGRSGERAAAAITRVAERRPAMRDALATADRGAR